MAWTNGIGRLGRAVGKAVVPVLVLAVVGLGVVTFIARDDADTARQHADDLAAQLAALKQSESSNPLLSGPQPASAASVTQLSNRLTALESEVGSQYALDPTSGLQGDIDSLRTCVNRLITTLQLASGSSPPLLSRCL